MVIHIVSGVCSCTDSLHFIVGPQIISCCDLRSTFSKQPYHPFFLHHNFGWLSVSSLPCSSVSSSVDTYVRETGSAFPRRVVERKHSCFSAGNEDCFNKTALTLYTQDHADFNLCSYLPLQALERFALLFCLRGFLQEVFRALTPYPCFGLSGGCASQSPGSGQLVLRDHFQTCLRPLELFLRGQIVIVPSTDA